MSQGPAALLQWRKKRGGSAACSGASQIRSQGRERGRPRGSRGGRGECSSREGRAAALQQEERGGGAGVGELLRPLAASARGRRGSRGGRRRGERRRAATKKAHRLPAKRARGRVGGNRDSRCLHDFHGSGVPNNRILFEAFGWVSCFSPPKICL